MLDRPLFGTAGKLASYDFRCVGQPKETECATIMREEFDSFA